MREIINLTIEGLWRDGLLTEDVKTCPFCGGVAKLENTHTPYYWVECIECGAEKTADIHSYKNEKEHYSKKLHTESALRAIELWNQRV